MQWLKKMVALVCAWLLMVASASAAPASLGVTYEIFVASFQDSNGDGVGDLQGIISRMDYLESLGVKQLWLMPIHPSPSYHKYDVTDYEAIDTTYGTLEDFEQLIAACDAHGMRVMLDLVVNHTSSQHPWFKEACQALAEGTDSPYIQWYNFAQTSGDGYHAVPGADGWWYEGRFGDHMPDLNLDNEDVRAEIAHIITLWQSRGVKGFRLDAVTSYYTGATGKNADFLRFVNETAKANDPECYVVAEAWTDEATMLNLYASGIDSLFNFPGADSTGTLLKAALKGNGAVVAKRLAAWNEQLREANPNGVDAPFLTNHDMGRAAGVLRLGLDQEKAAAMLYLLLPGVPTVYYGEELGMTGSGRDENKRLPMQWSAADETALCNPPADADQHQRLKEGVDVQDNDPDSLLNCYRQLIAMRNQAPEMLHGTMTCLDAGSDSVAFFTVQEEESSVVVLVNASAEEEITVDIPQLMGYTVLGSYGQVQCADAAVTLAPISCVLLRVE